MLKGAYSLGTTEPDGTLDPTIPAGFFAPNGEISDPTIPDPAPEFPAPLDGTPNIGSKLFRPKFCVSHGTSVNTRHQLCHSRV